MVDAAGDSSTKDMPMDGALASTAVATPETPPAAAPANVPDVAAPSELMLQLRREADAMASYALGNGQKLSPDIMKRLDLLDSVTTRASLPDLAALHNQLAEVVAPATPRAILLIDTDRFRGTALAAFGPMPNIRYLLLAALLFLLIFVLTSLSSHVNSTSIVSNIYAMEGERLLHVLLFLLSAAGLGASFASLSKAYTYVQAGTYDPRFDSSYWIRIALGIIAGLLISQLVPIEAPVQSGSNAVTDGKALGKPLLALLGGYSADMVNNILQRLVETVQAMFKGNPAEAAVLRESAAKVKADKQMDQQRVAVAGDIMALREAIASGADKDRLAQLTSAAMERLMPGAGASPPVATGPVSTASPTV